MVYMEKYKKSHTKTKHLKCQLQHETRNLNYEMGYILYQIFRVILSISSKNMKQ